MKLVNYPLVLCHPGSLARAEQQLERLLARSIAGATLCERGSLAMEPDV